MRYQSQFPPSGDGGYEEVLRARQVATAAKRWIVARATNDHFHRLATVATKRSCANTGSHRGQAVDRSMRYQSQFPPSGDGAYEEVIRARHGRRYSLPLSPAWQFALN